MKLLRKILSTLLALALGAVGLAAFAVGENEPSASIQIEGSDPLTLDSNSESTQYLSYSNDSTTQIEFSLNTPGSVVMELYRFQSQETLAYFDTLVDQDLQDLSGIQGALSFSACASNDTAECNLFRLEVDVFPANPINEGDFDSYTIYLLKRTSENAPQVILDWNTSTTEVQMSEQGWYRLPDPQSFNPPKSPEFGTFFLGFEVLNRHKWHAFDQYVPIFSDTTFVAISNNLPGFWIMNNYLFPDLCGVGLSGPEAEIELCLRLDSEAYQLLPIYFDTDTFAFYPGLITSFDFRNPQDDSFEGIGQEIRAYWPDGSSNVSLTVAHQDHRIPSGFQQPLQSQFIEGIPDEGTPDTSYVELPDEIICEADSNLCRQVWSVEVSYIDEGGYQRYFRLNTIIFDGATFEPEGPILAPKTARMHQDAPNDQSEPLTLHIGSLAGEPEELPPGHLWVPTPWLKLPDHESWMPQFFGPRKENHHLAGWTSTSNVMTDYFVDYYFPFVQDEDDFYPVWLPIYAINFYNGNSIIHAVEIWGENQFDEISPSLPQGATGWSATPGGQLVSNNLAITQATNFYAVFPAQNQNNFVQEPAPQAPASTPANPSPTATPAPPAEPTATTSKPKTEVKISYQNGVTTVAASIPPTYVNRGARIEQRVIVNGKVRYTTLGRGWTHFDKTTKDQSKAVMTFRFSKQLEATDRFRVVVRGVTVIKSFGDGKPAWR